jgi:hypothetical protein
LPEAEFLSHPFLDRKLRVVDSFEPKKPLVCPSCRQAVVKEIRVVSSEYPGGVQYHVLNCEECSDPQWFLLRR